uniref:leucine--tRNA ligase n=1 Tax=Globodera pallida TaxID=36090 RepID=A0A183BKP5_GLOPA
MRRNTFLSMFPYPSGRLHMGHLRVYTLSDALSRYYALKGYRVVHPIGWDAFGLPAENAAREKGIDAAEWTYKNIEEMRSQLTKTGVNFDWDREIFTCKPEYFQWTQWIFLQLYKHGLVRKTLSEVNWDPVDGTVLADEQVDENGCSWRSGAPVEKRRLRQWAVDTPRYAKRMLDGLGPLEFDWRGVADIQAAWIGTCDVYRFLLKTEVPAPNNGQPCVDGDEQFDLRLADPAQLGGAQFVVISKEHSLAREAEKRAKLADGELFTILENLCVINFVTGHRLPVVISHAKAAPKDNFILNARLGNASSTDPLDKAVSARLGLNASSSHIGISAEEVLMLAKDNNLGGYLTSQTLRDWIVSRQRAWGTPIPMVLAEHDDGPPAGNASLTAVEPMAEHRLPLLSAQRGQRTEAASLPSGWGRVETDTLDTYFDSSWYYLRYLDPNNEKMAFNPEIVNRSMVSE